MRYLIVITVLLGIGYSQCNESNWQDYYNSEGHNMVGCDLEGADLEGAYLVEANLREALLENANLREANLGGANLTLADLVDAYLFMTDLEGALLDSASLHSATLYQANLYGASLHYASLHYANLYQANLTEANLEEAYLVEANLREANLYEANLEEAYLVGANLEGANLEGANLGGANLCNLTGSPSGDVCEESGGIIDNNGDGYDDASYDAGVASVDITVDNQESYDEGYAAGLLLSTHITISVTEGWNMISSLPHSVNVDDIQDPNDVIPTNGIYGYEDGSYTAPTVLTPGEGYWLRALGDGEITLNSSNNG